MSDDDTIILCNRLQDPFSRVSKAMLSDDRLSWKAKGMLAYLLGQKQGWEIRTEDLIAKSTDGRDGVLSGLNNLREHGYAELSAHRDESGRVVRWKWRVSDTPIFTKSESRNGKSCSG